MKSTERFKETIKAYLDKRAETDELFRVRYEATTRTIDDVVTYILNQVKASGCCGFSDEAERIGEMIYNREIDEAGFRKKTRSLYPYVAEIYGWKTGRFGTAFNKAV